MCARAFVYVYCMPISLPLPIPLPPSHSLARSLSLLTLLHLPPSLVLERHRDAQSFFHVSEDDDQHWKSPMKQRKYYKGVPELERKDLQDRFAEIKSLWKHLSRGANTGLSLTIRQLHAR